MGDRTNIEKHGNEPTLSQSELYALLKIKVIQEVKDDVTKWEQSRLSIIGIIFAILGSLGVLVIIPQTIEQNVNKSIDKIVEKEIAPLLGKTEKATDESLKSTAFSQGKSQDAIARADEAIEKANQASASVNAKLGKALEELNKNLANAKKIVNEQIRDIENTAASIQEQLNDINQLSQKVSDEQQSNAQRIAENRKILEKQFAGLQLTLQNFENQTDSGTRLVNALIEQASNGPYEQRIAAVTALGQRGNQSLSALPTLKEMLLKIPVEKIHTPEHELAEATAIAVAKIANESAINYFFDIYKMNDLPFALIISVGEGLSNIGPISLTGITEFKNALIWFSSNHFRRCSLAEALYSDSLSIASSSQETKAVAIELLAQNFKDRKCLQYSSWVIRNYLYLEATSILPVIETAFDEEKNDTVRSAVKEAIDAIKTKSN